MHEAVGKVPFGTLVGWRTPTGPGYGVFVGKDGKDLLCLTVYDKTLKADQGLKFYRDESMSGKLASLIPSLSIDLQRVPASRAFRRGGRITGTQLQPYIQAAAHLQLEGIDMLSEKKWIQQAVKRPGRLPKLLGLSQDEYDALSKTEKLKKINAALKALEGATGKATKSKRSALVLGKRFVGGKEFKRRRESVDFAEPGAKLAAIWETLDSDLTEDEMEESMKAALHWVKQKYGAAKMKAHQAFLKMVRKDPAAHRRKMRQDKKYHRLHKWHDALMRKTARKGWARRAVKAMRAGVEIPDEWMVLDERDAGQAFMDLPFELRVTERSDPASMKVQTLIFSKDKFSKRAAVKWAATHGFKVPKVDEKENTYRIRQRDPDEFETFRTISFKPGLKAVVAKQ